MGKTKSLASQTYREQPHLLSIEKLLSELETTKDSGLSSLQVQQYQQKYGENKLRGDGGVSWYSVLAKQIANAMVLVSPQPVRHSVHF